MAIALLGICACFATEIAAIHPIDFFGLSEDDSIYFSSARALANGHGYILENMPGSPRATKYPVLYPWILSWIWRWHPDFPANLKPAVALNVSFGFVFIFATFLFLRSLNCLTDLELLLLVAFCCLHPIVIFNAANLLSDIPFAAVVLTAIAVLLWALHRDSGWLVLCSGFLGGVAFSLRTLGLPIVIGLALGLGLQRRWKSLALYLVGTAPLVFLLYCMAKPPGSWTGPGDSLCSEVWRANSLYYVNYLGFWRVDILQSHVFWQSLKQNFLLVLLQPGSYVVDPNNLSGLLAFAPALVLSAMALSGCWKRVRDRRIFIVMLGALIYALPVVFWDYPAMSRFFIPFLPLFAAGTWLEGKRIFTNLAGTVRVRGLSKDGLAILFLSFALSALFCAAVWSLWNGHLNLIAQGKRRSLLGLEKKEAYNWLRDNAPSQASVIAYEDASLFLYSGHPAVRPIIFLPAGRFKPGLLQSELTCIAENSKRIRATYWVASDDDFGFEWEPAASSGLAREKDYLANRPAVFRSSRGRVQIYDVSGQKPPVDSIHR